MHDEVDHFRLLRYLGTSGISEVFLALDVALDRKVALKRPLRDAELGRDEVIRAEGRVLAGLSHPNVLVAHELGEHAGRPYLVMEYSEGGSLSGVIEHEVLAIDAVCALMAQIADAVHYIHRRGLLHRSISPLSVFVDGSGRAKLGGFVVATLADDVEEQRYHVPVFLSPEQREPEGQPTQATDVWGLGITLFCGLAGRPFQEVVRDCLHPAGRHPGPIREANPLVPGAVATIVDRCLAVRPADRFPSALEVRDALIAAAGAPKATRQQVFVSYATTDQDFVTGELAPFLQRHEVDVWYAETSIPSAALWERAILSAMESSDWFVLVMSRNSAASEWVKDEVAWAVEHRRSKIVPVLLDDCRPIDFHIAMTRIQWLDYAREPARAREQLLGILKA